LNLGELNKFKNLAYNFGNILRRLLRIFKSWKVATILKTIRQTSSSFHRLKANLKLFANHNLKMIRSWSLALVVLPKSISKLQFSIGMILCEDNTYKKLKGFNSIEKLLRLKIQV